MKEIEKISDLEKLKILKEKMDSTREQIRKYSIYNMDDIGEAIAKVMSAYEGIDYISVRNYYTINEDLFYSHCLKEKSLSNENYKSVHIIPKKPETKEYARYRLTYNKDINDKDLCYLPPTYRTPHKKCYYIKDFINYLYIRKVENDIINDREFYLMIADEFINNTKEEQAQRQKMIKIEYQSKLGEKAKEYVMDLKWGGWPYPNL